MSTRALMPGRSSRKLGNSGDVPTATQGRTLGQ